MYSYELCLMNRVQARLLADDDFLPLKDARIAVVKSDQKKQRNGRTVFADTRKINEINAFLSGYDFVIAFYADAEFLAEPALDVLIEHELRHIGVEHRNGEIRFRIVPHDVEDFRCILDAYGWDWPLLGCGERTKEITEG